MGRHDRRITAMRWHPTNFGHGVRACDMRRPASRRRRSDGRHPHYRLEIEINWNVVLRRKIKSCRVSLRMDGFPILAAGLRQFLLGSHTMSVPNSAGQSAHDPDSDQLISPAAAARLLSCSLPTVRRIKQLQPILLREGGRSVRYSLAQIRRYLAGRSEQQSPTPPPAPSANVDA